MKKSTVLLGLVFAITMTSLVSAVCNDPDGGINYFQKSIIDASDIDGHYGDYPEDYCEEVGDKQSVIEQYCTAGGAIGHITGWCLNGCNDGACIGSNEDTDVRFINKCEETDNENDKHTKGSVTVTYNDGYTETYNDECTSWTYYGQKEEGLKEYLCAESFGNPTYTFASETCTCSDGRCLKEDEIPKLPDLIPTTIRIRQPVGEIVEGDDIEVAMSVKNLGKKQIPPGGDEWTITWYVDKEIVSETTNSYAPLGEDTAFGDITWIRNLPVGEHILKVEVDKGDNIEELDEDNNVFERTIFVVSSKLNAEFFFLNEGNQYVLYIQPIRENANINDIYIGATFDGHRTVIDEEDDEIRETQVVSSVSNNPNARSPTVFPYDENIDAYRVKEVSKQDYKDIWEEVSIFLDYRDERRKITVPVEDIDIKEVVVPEKDPVDIPEGIEIIDDGQEKEIIFLCQGCELDKKCYPIGYRKEGNYCSEDNDFRPQVAEELTCENNFECTSNVCVENKCVSGSLIWKIINWFKKLFGIN